MQNRILAMALLATGLAFGQTSIYVPSNTPGAGTCNTIPFGQSATFAAGYTYLARIPASSMDPANPVITDVSFAPCGTGNWSAPDVQIVMGHIPNPQPCPFNFPIGGLGNMKDATVLYDSVTQGAFSWDVTLDTWSPMNLAGGPSGLGFKWNGTDDVAFFMTFQNAVVTGFNGSFHRTGTIPERTYAAGYNTATSTTCLAASGLIMRLTASPTTVVCLPDSDPTTGTCNVIPFGQTATFANGYTYVARIPAANLDTNNPVIKDVAFTPCGTGNWSSGTVLIGMGHIPNPQPCPFNFPSGAGLGDFSDFTVLYDSASQGAFSWNVTANTWSPMNLAGGPCSEGFRWNRVDDVAFFMTFQSATVTGFGGDFHRSDTIPERTYAAGYLATASTTCLAASGLKMCLYGDNTAIGQWQVNQPGSSLTVNNRPSNPWGPLGTTLGVNQPAVANFASTNVGLGWDVSLTSPETGLPANGGGFRLSDCQIIHTNFLAPSLLHLFNLQFNVPWAANFNAPFSIPAAVEVSAQLVNLDPGQPVGISLSASNRVTVCNAVTLPGPTGDDSSVAISLGSAGLCGNDISFFGTVYDTMHVISNGRVMFGGADTDFSPSVTDALADNPFVGFWTDFNPFAGGTISVSSPSQDEVQVNFNGVEYFGEAGVGATFAIRFNTLNGNVALEGLSGIPANPQIGVAFIAGDSQFLGLSRGNTGALDAGPITFAPGGSGLGVSADNMLYDFYDQATGVGGLCPSLAGGVNNILFVPSSAGSYNWSAN